MPGAEKGFVPIVAAGSDEWRVNALDQTICGRCGMLFTEAPAR
jgi:hypothetical protein